MALSTEPIRLDSGKLRQMPYVPDDNRYYRATLQLGARRTWRNYGSGKWVKDQIRQAEMPEGMTAYVHKPKVHVTEPMPSWTLNGLISEHNLFLNANATGDRGLSDVGRMMVVTGYEECAAPEAKLGLPPGFESMMTRLAAGIVQETTKATIAALADAGLIGADKASGKAKRGTSASGESGSLPLGDSGN
jgi:hypothetical protein